MFKVLLLLSLFMGLITSDYYDFSSINVDTNENVVDSIEEDWAFAEPIVSRDSNATLQAIEPRDFLDSVVKGICLLSELKDRTGERSNYTQFSMLGASGCEYRSCDSKPSQYSAKLLTQQHWADNDFECQWWTYRQPWKQPPYTASYKLMIDITHGVIMTASIFAPQDPIIRLPGPMPAVWPPRRVSDIMYLVHQQLCNNAADCLTRLSYVIHVQVYNPECTTAVVKAMDGHEPADPADAAWPGQIFGTGGDTSEQGVQAVNALVGCPNGRGSAFLLSQHLSSYGWKTIDSVYVFKTNNGELGLAWHFGNLP